MELSKAQSDMLALHAGSTEAKPRRRKYNQAAWEAKEVSFFNNTAWALLRRGLMDYRGGDKRGPGGWYLTKAGRQSLTAK